MNMFATLFKKDLMTMQKGGIPKFKRQNFLRALESILNPGLDQNKEPETFKEKFIDKTKKISYPIAWIDFYKENGKSQLMAQVCCGCIIQIIVLILQISIYEDVKDDVGCRDGFSIDWDFIVLLIVHVFFIPNIIMMVWFLRHKVIPGKMDVV
jgi:hypothetical protein